MRSALGMYPFPNFGGKNKVNATSPFLTLLPGTRARLPVTFYGTHFSRWKGLFKITALPAYLFPSLWLVSFCYPRPSLIFHSFSSGLTSIISTFKKLPRKLLILLYINFCHPILYCSSSTSKYFSRAQGLLPFLCPNGGSVPSVFIILLALFPLSPPSSL